MADQHKGEQSGSLVLHLWSLLALLLLLVNDHYGKGHWPGLVSGKLSDLAGSFFVVVLTVSLVELVRVICRRPQLMSGTGVTVVAAAVAAGLIGTKTTHGGASVYGDLLGAVRWCFTGAYHRVVVVVDPTDLVALSTVLAAWAFCLHHRSATCSAPSSP